VAIDPLAQIVFVRATNSDVFIALETTGGPAGIIKDPFSPAGAATTLS
jgi:hypothetical protein